MTNVREAVGQGLSYDDAGSTDPVIVEISRGRHLRDKRAHNIGSGGVHLLSRITINRGTLHNSCAPSRSFRDH